VLAVSLGDGELENSGSQEELFLPATVLRRLKTARGFDRGTVIADGLSGLGLGPGDD